MRNWIRASVSAIAIAIALSTGALTATAADAESASDIEALKREIDELKAQQRRYQQRIDALSEKVDALSGTAPAPPAATAQGSDAAASALDKALADVEASATPSAAAAPAEKSAPDLRLIDLSMNILTAVGGSTEHGDSLEELEAGAHDPDRNGFTFQQAELSASGAVDPYLRGDVHIVGSTDEFDLEEAFVTTTALPAGLQVKAGYFLTEFGILNSRHPHSWDWLDQPVILSRLFGGESLRSPGARIGWLAPVPWFSELDFGVQDPDNNDFTVSFVGNGALGRPAVSRDVKDPEDMLYSLRWVNSVDLSRSTTLVWGLSGLHGPNDTGSNADTWIYGTDVKLRWRPQANFRGWPFLLWQTEILGRSYEAAAYDDGTTVLPSETLEDAGGYTQVLYGFHPGWAVGARYEYASGSGRSTVDGVSESREDDPTRDDRQRFSPLLVWHPTHFSRLRLQYNYDVADHLSHDDAHSVWLGLEVVYGMHGAHEY